MKIPNQYNTLGKIVLLQGVRERLAGHIDLRFLEFKLDTADALIVRYVPQQPIPMGITLQCVRIAHDDHQSPGTGNDHIEPLAVR